VSPFELRHPALIHPSAWNRNSANFAITAFCEVQLNGILGVVHILVYPGAGPSSTDGVVVKRTSLL
jgi:hypothetical protein